MAGTGNTTTDALADSLNTVVMSARLVREYEGVMPQLVDLITLTPNMGLSWHEIDLAQLTASAITESTDLDDNPQQLSDAKLSVTPTLVGIHTLITDRMAVRISTVTLAKIGSLAQNAIQRKKDEDGLVVLDGATTSLSGAGTTLTTGHISAASNRILSNATEAAVPPINAVLHGFQLRDIETELTGGIGTYTDVSEFTARVFQEGFRGVINMARVFEDGNITIDGSDDAKGGVFAKMGIVLVQGRAPRAAVDRKENIGGGATALYIYDEYAYGERSAGNWLYEIYSDATAPTS